MTTKRETNKEPDVAAEESEVQKKMDAIKDQGFIGVKVDAHPNEAYSLESGPDSPGVTDVSYTDEK